MKTFQERLTDFADFYNEIMPIARDMISEKEWRIYRELDKQNTYIQDKSWFDKPWDIHSFDEKEMTLYYSDRDWGDEFESIPFWAFEDKENWYLQCIAKERAARKTADDINRDIRKKNAQNNLEAAQRELDRLNNPDA